MDKITVGVLTISDRCDKKEAVDESGPNLAKLISGGIVQNGVIEKILLVPDSKEDIERVLIEWSECGVHLILTTGGTGISARDVTPEATAAVLEKTLLGISQLMFKHSSEVTVLAALSRAIAGVRGRSLIINLPGSKKASQECLEAVAAVIPHAVHLINGKNEEVGRVHSSLGEKKSSVVEGGAAGRRRESEYSCISVGSAQAIVLDRIYLLRREITVPYDQAVGYVLAQSVVARDELPPFDCSLMDGYAVMSTDKMLQRNLLGVSQTGGSLIDVAVITGHCVRVSTGAALPSGADAVVPVEDTTLSVATENQMEENQIAIKKQPYGGQNIRRKGSDFKMGQMLLETGTYLDPACVGLIAAAGQTSVRVFSKPVVAVISTGDELVNPNEKVGLGKIRDSNRIALLSLLKEENFPTVDGGIVPDTPNALRNALERGFKAADIVVTTGSMSMGEKDYLKRVLISDFNAEICFGRVLMKPGKPTSFAIVTFEEKPKLWFGLPGNPASALVTSHLFLLPALRKISGLQNVFPASIKVKICGYLMPSDRPHYVRAVLEKNDWPWTAKVIGSQISSRIGSCVNAECIVEVPSTTQNTVSTVKTTQNTFGVNTSTMHTDPLMVPRKEEPLYKAYLIGKIYTNGLIC